MAPASSFRDHTVEKSKFGHIEGKGSSVHSNQYLVNLSWWEVCHKVLTEQTKFWITIFKMV